MPTERLYYHDSYARHFRARVIAAEEGGRRVLLDRTAFYPTSGGQPFDTGMLGGVAVREVIDEEDRVVHVLGEPLGPDALAGSSEVEGSIDWVRRWDHMQQHTGQHLLSAVLEELFGMATLSFHLGAETSTIDIRAAALTPQQIEQAETRCAEVVATARPVRVEFEDASAAEGLRKASEREGTLRIVSIEGIDRSACGGTHVRCTSEIGLIQIRKLDKIRGNVRLEFVCGLRALGRVREDYRLLAALSRTLAVPLEETPAAAATLVERNKALEKSTARLATELAGREGADLHRSTEPDADGIRRITQRGAIDDSMRARAQAFVAGSKALFLAVCDDPPSLLLAASADSGVHAEECVKAAVTAAGGHGGGNAALAQGSVSSRQVLEDIIRSLL
ncbi:MAG TPA: alanyl-tRNA editing protein [Bryobacteraceae bacterium]|nr:alanyl-tRNA editing protein [Bryobacteraceae bacterium]